jgi:hypothetical protein
MSEMLSTSSVMKLFHPNGLYLIGYAWLFGMCELHSINHDESLILTVFSFVDNILWRYTIQLFLSERAENTSMTYTGIIAYKTLRWWHIRELLLSFNSLFKFDNDSEATFQ